MLRPRNWYVTVYNVRHIYVVESRGNTRYIFKQRAYLIEPLIASQVNYRNVVRLCREEVRALASYSLSWPPHRKKIKILL